MTEVLKVTKRLRSQGSKTKCVYLRLLNLEEHPEQHIEKFRFSDLEKLGDLKIAARQKFQMEPGSRWLEGKEPGSWIKKEQAGFQSQGPLGQQAEFTPNE